MGRMTFEELDVKTRKYVLQEFEQEEASGHPFRSAALNEAGLAAFPQLMREAITDGDETSLAAYLSDPALWHPTESYVRDGVTRERRRNVRQAAERLAQTEFNTWYVRGLAKRLLDEGTQQCQVYRAAMPKWEPGECSAHEGKIMSVDEIYRNHRALLATSW